MTLTALATQLQQALAGMSGWELAGVVLGIAYLLLAVRESLWCWYAAFLSTAIFLFVFWDVGLLMESALQVYYLAMAVYGWWHWQQGRQQNESAGDEPSTQLAISRWHSRQHLCAIAAVLVLSFASGLLLQRYTSAALPFLDSFTTWGSILTTWMVARKILENWLYWLVIDSVSVYLYVDRELYLTAALFVAYLFIVIVGYRKWLQHYRNSCA